ncbi:MAG: ABC transporter permease [Bacteroidetes bacterium]|nr:ABC transporter permease [Bacteroidota bacterium]
MFKAYFKIAYRNLIRDRQFTLLNLVGLSIGLTCTLLIYLWVSDELSIGKFSKKDNRLFQVLANNTEAGNIQTTEHVAGLLANALATEMPEVESAATSVPASWFSSKGILSVGVNSVRASEQYISKDYLKIFPLEFIAGDQQNAVPNKSSIAISEELAMKLFHTTQNVIGKVVEWKHEDSGTDFGGIFTVSGVFKKPPPNSEDQFDLLFNYDLFVDKRPGMLSWFNGDPNTYVILKEGTNEKQFNDKIKNFIRAKQQALYGSKNLEWIGTLFIQRYSDRYLYNRYENGVPVGGRIAYVRLFSIIALFILIVACINFMNLSTAKAAKRMKEVGIKKVMGATRSSLIFHYLGESVLMSFLSLAIAIALLSFFLPTFNQIAGKHLTLHFNVAFILSILAITLFTGLIAGSYPALYLSGAKPITVLKGKLNPSLIELWIRKGLVIFQFTLSAIFIVSVLVVYKQIKLIQTKNLGYDKENVISFRKEGKWTGDVKTFFADAKKIPGVLNASSASGDLIGDHGGTSNVEWEGKKKDQEIEFGGLWVDYDWVETMGLQLSAGRSFSPKFGSDSSAIMLNEAAITAMNMKNPIGKTIKLWGRDMQIVGVLKNFHFESFYEKLKPCFIQYSNREGNIIVRLSANNQKETLTHLNKIYKAYNPGVPFEYKFLDENYNQLYASEQRVAVLSRYAAGLAILISGLGLFGLAAFTTQKRQKEIGIRKVIGASVKNVIFLLSKEFIKLILVAMLIAFPLSFLIMNKWLEGFAYRVHMDVIIFIATGFAVLSISILTISFQSIKAAMMNPVKSLRTE